MEKVSKSISRSLVFAAVIFTIAQTVLAQDSPLKKINTITLKGVADVALDRLGNLYTVEDGLTLNKYDTDGNFLFTFSNLERIPLTQIEPWNPLRIFVYSKEGQEILILDRSLVRQERISVDASLAIEPTLGTPSSNNSYWLFDKSDLTLKKVDLENSEILMDIHLTKIARPSSPDFIELREYQNMLFLLDIKTGIEIYSIVGKRIHKIEATTIAHFGFLGQELYYLEGEILKFYDLYTEEIHELPVGKVKQALATDERLILVKEGLIEIFEFNPSR